MREMYAEIRNEQNAARMLSINAGAGCRAFVRSKEMKKIPFITKSQAEEIAAQYPTPFHIYDEHGIRENARLVKQAFAWNKGFREYFAVKATPNPFILKILQEEGCGVDCSSLTELQMADACGFSGSDIMFSSNVTRKLSSSLS